MIPEVYWKFLWRWGWLIGIFFVIGSGGAYLLSQMVLTYESRAAIEVTHVIDAYGVVSYDEFDRRAEANVWAQHLRGSWVTERLMAELSTKGIQFPDTEEMSIEIVPPRRGANSVGLAIIQIRVQHADPILAQSIASTASEVYADYITERQVEFLSRRREEVNVQVDRLMQDLLDVLTAKRAALSEEATRIIDANETNLEANEFLLSQLPVLLEEFRVQIGFGLDVVGTGPKTLDVSVGDLQSRIESLRINGIAADQELLNASIRKLRLEIEDLHSDWQTRITPTLSVLYTAEAQPEFQLALAQERPIGAKYESSLIIRNTLLDIIDARVVTVLSAGTSPELVSNLGVRTRFLLVGGGGIGLILGWIMANLGEYLLLLRTRRNNPFLSPPAL